MALLQKSSPKISLEVIASNTKTSSCRAGRTDKHVVVKGSRVSRRVYAARAERRRAALADSTQREGETGARTNTQIGAMAKNGGPSMSRAPGAEASAEPADTVVEARSVGDSNKVKEQHTRSNPQSQSQTQTRSKPKKRPQSSPPRHTSSGHVVAVNAVGVNAAAPAAAATTAAAEPVLDPRFRCKKCAKGSSCWPVHVVTQNLAALRRKRRGRSAVDAKEPWRQLEGLMADGGEPVALALPCSKPQILNPKPETLSPKA